MTLKEQVFAQALMMTGELDGPQTDLLDALCGASTAALVARLRDGLNPDDCRADFVAAASLFALAAMNEAGLGMDMEEFRAGDLTVKRGGGDAASRCLRRQADLIIAPYLKDSFSFRGV